MSARIFTALAVLLTTFVGSEGFAQARRCADLPPVSATEATSTSLTVVNLPRIPSAKELYLRAMCGVRPATIWGLIDSGEGALVDVPAELAADLDAAIPYLPAVRYMYVRGGGPDREAIVILFADGYDGPFFEFDHDEPWTAASAQSAVDHWNQLPYGFLRRATRQAHDIARFRHEFTFSLTIVGFDITLYTQGRGRGLANPMGTIFGATHLTSTTHDLEREDDAYLWNHELGHYLHYEYQGANALAYARGFTAISRKNGRILGVRIPFWFKERYSAADNESCSGQTAAWVPWGYTSRYARCGEAPTAEDFADSAMAAVGASQALLSDPDRPAAYNLEYAPSRLFGRTGSDDFVMAERAQFFREHLSVDLFGPQDADEDGIPWQDGRVGGDCGDINPVAGECRTGECTTHADCDDGDPCTIDVCGDRNHCQGRPVDDDADGSADIYVDADGDGVLETVCPGGDCEPGNPAVFEGTSRECVNDCGATRVQVCTSNGEYSECPSPDSCECLAGETMSVGCGELCGVSVVECDGAGWGEAGACMNEGECIAGSRTLVGSVVEEIRCAGGGVRGLEYYDEYSVCESTCMPRVGPRGSLRLERELVGRDEVSSPEICDDIDNDCEGTIDNGCPTSLRESALPEGSYRGRDRGDWGTSLCPSGSVVVGLDVDRLRDDGTRLDGLRVRCRPLIVERDRSTVPHTFDVLPSPFQTFNGAWAHGGTVNQRLDCPAGMAAVAIRARNNFITSANYLTGVALECAPIHLSSRYTLSTGAVTETASWPRLTDEVSRCGGFVSGLANRRTSSGLKGVRARCARYDVNLIR